VKVVFLTPVVFETIGNYMLCQMQSLNVTTETEILALVD